MSCGEGECVSHFDALQDTIDDQADEIERLKKEVAELRKLTGWQPIETATDGNVLLYYPKRMGRNDLSEWITIGWPIGLRFREPTHWFPIPKPPAVEGES